jgi:hypothetical protein
MIPMATDTMTRKSEPERLSMQRSVKPRYLSEIDEKDVPKKERLERKISLQGRAVYLIKND